MNWCNDQDNTIHRTCVQTIQYELIKVKLTLASILPDGGVQCIYDMYHDQTKHKY